MSTLKADTIQNTSGGAVTLTNQSAAKAWINFNGTGTVAVRSSLNTSSITDVAQGSYTPNVSGAFNDANYAPSGNAAVSTAGAGGRFIQFGSNYDAGALDPNFTTTSFSVNCFYPITDGDEYDVEYITISVHGDLA
jgi:hypothetical protein